MTTFFEGNMMPEKTRAQLVEEIERLRQQIRTQEQRLSRLEVNPAEPAHAESPSTPRSSAPFSSDVHGCLNVLLELLAEGGVLIGVDPRGTVQFLRGFGRGDSYDPAAYNQGERWLNWVAPEDRERVAVYHRLLESESSGEEIEVRLRLPGRELETFRLRGGSESQRKRTWYVARSATDAPDLAATSDIASWAATFAHEMNQPLSVVLTTAQACQRLVETGQAEPGEIEEALASIVRKATHAAAVVRGLREWATETPPRRQRVQMNDVLKQAVESLHPALDAAAVRVEFDLTQDLPPVCGDAAQLCQVAVNLIRNAMEAVRENPPQARGVMIGTRREGTDVVATVVDHGPGLSADLVDRLFTPLTSTKPQGMGLGLAICRRLVQAHQGRLWVETNSPSGCIFSFSVPMEALE